MQEIRKIKKTIEKLERKYDKAGKLEKARIEKKTAVLLARLERLTEVYG